MSGTVRMRGGRESTVGSRKGRGRPGWAEGWASWGAAVLRPYVIGANVEVWAVLDLNPHPWRSQGCGTQRPSRGHGGASIREDWESEGGWGGVSAEVLGGEANGAGVESGGDSSG